MAKANVFHVDASGISHRDRECEEFTGASIGSLPLDSAEARVQCADCD